MEEIINKVIEHLKSNRIHYRLDNDVIYLEISSLLLCGVFIEDEETVQFYCGNEYDVYKYYQSHIMENAKDNVIEGLENFISFVKEMSVTINKIKRKIDEIVDICDENNLEVEDFITVNLDDNG